MRDILYGKRVLVVGLARSGRAAGKLLLSLGAIPVLNDMKTEVDGLEEFTGRCDVALGIPPQDLLHGCAAVIISPAVPLEAPIIGAAADRGIPVWSELEFASRYVQGTQIAITGTNGKTTTATLLGQMLKNAGWHAYVAGNIGIALSEIAPDTKPGDIVVIEVSSFQLEHIDAFHPHGSAILNLTPDHLNRHGTMASYGALKEGMLRNQLPTDFFVYNRQDAFCRTVASRCAARTIPFASGQDEPAGAGVAGGRIAIHGSDLCDVHALSLPGMHNLENALAAAAIAYECGTDLDAIRHTLQSFQGVAHRMEHVPTTDAIRWINDSKATNPESAIFAVDSMRVPTVLIAGGDEKNSDFTAFAAAVVANQCIRHVILIGKSAGRMREALQIAGHPSIRSAGFDFEKAIDLARSLCVPGGAVLFSPACASFDMFADFEARGDAFKRLVVQCA